MTTSTSPYRWWLGGQSVGNTHKWWLTPIWLKAAPMSLLPFHIDLVARLRLLMFHAYLGGG